MVHMSASHAEVKETFLAPVRFFRENPPQVYHYPLRAEVGEDFPYHLIGFDRGLPLAGGGDGGAHLELSGPRRLGPYRPHHQAPDGAACRRGRE